MKGFKLIIAALLLASSGHAPMALAENNRSATIQDFLEFQAQLRDDLANGRYGSVSQNDMDLVVNSQRTLARILDGKSSIDELDSDERIAVFNAQETIVAVLTDTVDDTPLCRRQHTVGSHRQVTVCFTPRQRREMRSHAEDVYQHYSNILQQGIQTPPTDG